MFNKNGCWTKDQVKLGKCWQRLLGAFARRYTLVAQARKASELDPSCGILPDLDYTVLNVFVATDQADRKVKLV